MHEHSSTTSSWGRVARLRTAAAGGAALLLLLTAAACGNDSEVGDKSLLEFEQQGQDRLGQVTTTTAPSVTAPSTTAPPTTKAPAAKTPTTSPPTTAAAARFSVKIVGGGQGFDPFNFVVRKGTVVEVKNTDNQPRTFTSDEAGAFDSGPIPPGGVFTYTADRIGTFNFHDETRPFAVGQMEVKG